MQLAIEGMEPFPVFDAHSFLIEFYGYHAPSHSLVLKFRRQDVLYRYWKIPPGVWQDFYAAPSKSSYFSGVFKSQFGNHFHRIGVQGYRLIKTPARLSPNAGIAASLDVQPGSDAPDCWL